jgi:hypothetical protein
LYRSVKTGAQLFELLDDVVNVHGGILALGNSRHGLLVHDAERTASPHRGMQRNEPELASERVLAHNLRHFVDGKCQETTELVSI